MNASLRVTPSAGWRAWTGRGARRPWPSSRHLPTHSSTSEPSARLTTTENVMNVVGEASAASAAPVRARLRRSAAPAGARHWLDRRAAAARFLGRRGAQLAGVAVLDDDLRVGGRSFRHLGSRRCSWARLRGCRHRCAQCDGDGAEADRAGTKRLHEFKHGFPPVGSSGARPLVADEREGMDQQRAARRRFDHARGRRGRRA